MEKTVRGEMLSSEGMERFPRGKEVAEALLFATKASTITVSCMGASMSIPYAGELD